LWLECVDTIVAHTLDIEHLDSALALLEPQATGRLPRYDTTARSAQGYTICALGCVWLRWHKRALADGYDMSNTEGMEHVGIGRVV
jgi:hypothetical protein